LLVFSIISSNRPSPEDVKLHQDPPRLCAQSGRGFDAGVAVAAAGAAEGGAATQTAGGGAEEAETTMKRWAKTGQKAMK